MRGFIPAPSRKGKSPWIWSKSKKGKYAIYVSGYFLDYLIRDNIQKDFQKAFDAIGVKAALVKNDRDDGDADFLFTEDEFHMFIMHYGVL